MKGTTDSEIGGFISDGCTNARCQEHTKERNETIAIPLYMITRQEDIITSLAAFLHWLGQTHPNGYMSEMRKELSIHAKIARA